MRTYLKKRADKIRYGSLRRRDLEISTGLIEGAVNNIIAKPCDHGGMRWIEERAPIDVKGKCTSPGRGAEDGPPSSRCELPSMAQMLRSVMPRS